MSDSGVVGAVGGEDSDTINDFIVGYGLDYDGFGRNYPDIYTVVD